MKLIPVDQIPKMNGYHKLQDLIEEFVNGDAKIVRVVLVQKITNPRRFAGLVWLRQSRGQNIRSRYGVVVTKCF